MNPHIVSMNSVSSTMEALEQFGGINTYPENRYTLYNAHMCNICFLIRIEMQQIWQQHTRSRKIGILIVALSAQPKYIVPEIIFYAIFNLQLKNLRVAGFLS